MTVIARDDVTLALVTDVASADHYFQLKASTASAPTVPTVYPAPSPWVTTEPTYTEGATNSLYTVDVTVFSDGSFDYTPVSLSSSYEAAKAAYNKAQQAQTAADNAQTAANLALANAVNYIKNPQFHGSNLDSVRATQMDASDSNAGTLPAAASTYGKHIGWFDCVADAVRIRAIAGHTYRIEIDSKPASDMQSTNTTPFGLMYWCMTADNPGITADQYIMINTTATTVTDWTHSKMEFTYAGTEPWSVFRPAYRARPSQKWLVTNFSCTDVTEVVTAQKAADDAQAAATAAQTTADGKNKIFSSASEPSHTGIVPGDMWFQLDSNKNVSGIQVWNGSAFTDMVLLANELLVASSVGTTQIADNAIVTGKIAANAITAINIAAQTITGDKLDVGSVAAAIVTSGKFQTATSGARVVMDSNGIKAYDAAGNTTFQIEAATGKASLVGGMQTALSGKRISIAQSGDTGKVALLNDGSELSSLTFVDDTAHSGYVYTGLYTGQDSQFVQFATLVDNVNHQPDPKVYDVSMTARGKMLLDASNAINVNGTWFARDLASLPTAPQVVGEQGTQAFAGGIEYKFDGAGAWVSQTQTAWVVCDTGISYYKPTASGGLQALSVRKRSGVVELMGRISVGGTVQQNSDMGAMIPVSYRPTAVTMIQCDQSQWAQLNGPAWYVRPDGHIIWGPYKQNATEATFHGMWVGA